MSLTHDLEHDKNFLELIGRKEMERVVAELFRYRFFLIPLWLLIFFVFLLWDPQSWKLLSIGAMIIAIGVLNFTENQRARKRGISTGTVHFNLIIMIVLQSMAIFLTGGIESPLLPIYIPLCLAAGMLLMSWKRALSVAFLPVIFSAFFAIACLYGLVPRSVPAFFELGVGWQDMPVYVWTTAGVMMGISLMTYLVSSRIRRTLGNQVKSMMEARQEVVTSLSDMNREIIGVSRTIAHELKNPLASIHGLAQLMARSAREGSKEAERLEIMNREIARMGDVLEGFRNFTRPLSGLSLENIPLDHLVNDVVTFHEGMAEEMSVDLQFASVPVRVSCDPMKLQQALINIIQNALEACTGGGKVVVRVGEWAEDGARIEIQDSGAGLSEEYRAHLFEPGFTTKEKGSGIGLVVAKAIVEQHGGELEFEEGISSGCLVVVTLPKQPPAGKSSALVHDGGTIFSSTGRK